jgi:hypothetical protein
MRFRLQKSSVLYLIASSRTVCTVIRKRTKLILVSACHCHTAACKTVVTMQKTRTASFCLYDSKDKQAKLELRVKQHAARASRPAVGPERCLPSHCRLRVFVPGAAQTETRYADFWHRDYGFASSCKLHANANVSCLSCGRML